MHVILMSLDAYMSCISRRRVWDIALFADVSCELRGAALETFTVRDAGGGLGAIAVFACNSHVNFSSF